MALTVSDLLERARDRYNAVGDKFFGDALLRGFIFSAQDVLAKEGWVIEKTYTTTSTADTRTISWPSNTLAIKQVKYDYNDLFKRTLRADPKTSTSDPTGTPRGYAVWDEEIILYPTPDETGKVIQIRVYSYPQDVTTNSATIEVPQEYRDDLINFMLANMCLKDQRLSLHDRYEAKWLETVEKARQQRKRRLRADRPARVKDNYFGTDIPVTVDEVFYRGFTV
jgi:hypothetical protein